MSKLLQDTLLIWCKENPDVGYKQGMHELAGFVVWVELHCHTRDANSQISYTYHLFDALMKHTKAFYLPPTSGSVSAVAQKCIEIQENLVSVLDPQLFNRLCQLQLSPQIWGIKWIRCIFSREFDFDDVLEMWDLLFAADTTLDLIRYICCAMLMAVRSTGLNSNLFR